MSANYYTRMYKKYLKTAFKSNIDDFNVSFHTLPAFVYIYLLMKYSHLKCHWIFSFVRIFFSFLYYRQDFLQYLTIWVTRRVYYRKQELSEYLGSSSVCWWDLCLSLWFSMLCFVLFCCFCLFVCWFVCLLLSCVLCAQCCRQLTIRDYPISFL